MTSRMSRAFILCVCALLSATTNTGAQTEARPPRLTCRVIQAASAGGGAATAGAPFKASNLKRIQLEIKLSGSQLPPGGMTLRKAGQNTTDSAAPTVEIAVQMRTEKGLVPVVIKAEQKGYGMEPGAQYITVLLELPDDAKRKRDIEDYLRKLEERAVKEGRAAEFERLVKQNRAAVVVEYEKLYVDNRVGEFEVVCQYTSERPGAWKGVVKSEPIRVRVESEGNFFDLPNFN